MKEYNETIEGTSIIIPNPESKSVCFLKEQDMNVEHYKTILPELYTNVVRTVSIEVKNLLGQKVIFYPLKDMQEYKTMSLAINENNGIPVLDVLDIFSQNEKGEGTLVSRIKAEVYPDFAERDARRVNLFLQRYIYKSRR